MIQSNSKTLSYTCIIYSLNKLLYNCKLTCSIYGGTQTEDHKQGGDCCRSSETRHREYHKLDLLPTTKVVSEKLVIYAPTCQSALFQRSASSKGSIASA